MKKPVVLRIYRGEVLLGVHQFTVSQIVIGRQDDVQLPLNDVKVSIIHAAIEERDTGFYICDLGSESGTFKNGDKVLDSKIESGDTIQIADFRIEFFVGAPRPKTATSSTETVTETVTRPPIAVKPPERPLPKPVAPPDTKPDVTKVEKPPVAVVRTVSTAATPSLVPPATTNKSTPRSINRSSSGGEMGVAMISPSSTGVPKIPRARSRRKVEKTKKTYAPASKFQSVHEFVRPTKGTVVEVLVAWRERVISTYHFSGRAIVTMGSHPNCDIPLPVFMSKQRRVPILKLEGRAVVLITPEMIGELIRGQQSLSFVELLRQNRMVRQGAAYHLVLDQGELVQIELTESVSLIIRYVPDSPKPLVAPLFDLTAAEGTGILLALVLVAVLGLYMFLYTPPVGLGEEQNNEPPRTALIITKPPPIPIQKVAPVESATPPPMIKATPAPTKTVVKASVAKVQEQAPKKNPGAASDLAPNKNKTKRLGSIKQGGAVKTTEKEGAQAQSPRKDVSKSGIFSVFGNKGKQDQLSKSYSGVGELAGMANASSGKSGQATNRAGEGIGTPMKDTGVGGTGTAAIGVPGVKTHGRGGGESGFGEGGLGSHKGTQIIPGGQGESYSTGYDKEAVRRVVLAGLKALKSCYERALNRNPSLFGKVVLEWDIGERGRVVRARVKTNDLGDKAVGECALDRLKTWTFPEPPVNEEVTVAYPFFFSN